ncbi:hypothetical protein [Prevotella intermedia]|uniref:hypothetical protein n=1 Tax=Prevotella intermedia TaxID=28131 RepID=UPI00211D5DB0|nr:hypothetical protein [Prevotella intermedia]
MELEEQLLSEFGNRRPFKSPDGYFDNLETRIMSQITAKETEANEETQISKKVNTISFKRLRPLMIAASFIGLIIIGVITMHFFQDNEQLQQNNNIPATPTATTAKEESADTEYLDEAVEYMMLDKDDVYAYLADN